MPFRRQRTDDAPTPHNHDQHTEAPLPVLVIGAGAAGLAAASTLRAEGVDVRVLEARERIGGRIHTSHAWADLPVDLGALWIHGSEDNPLVELAEHADTPLVVCDLERMALYWHDGEPLSDDDLTLLDEHWSELTANVDQVRVLIDEAGDADIALGDVLEDWLDELEVAGAELQLLAWAVNTEWEHECTADVADLSLLCFDAMDAFDGDDLLLPRGYVSLLEPIARGLDVSAGQVVERISWSEQGVSVQVAGQDAPLQGSAVICTLPLGVLKADAVAFEPTLPREKQRAIERLGVGHVNRVWLRFTEVFWDADAHLLSVVSLNKGKWMEWLNAAPHTGQPVLVGLNAADMAREMDGWSEAEIIESAMSTLRGIYPDAPEPLAVQISRWSADPFAQGAGVYFATGSTPDDIEALAAPVGSTLFFAGEATHIDYPATVHGAWLSGQRAAEELLAARYQQRQARD